MALQSSGVFASYPKKNDPDCVCKHVEETRELPSSAQLDAYGKISSDVSLYSNGEACAYTKSSNEYEMNSYVVASCALKPTARVAARGKLGPAVTLPQAKGVEGVEDARRPAAGWRQADRQAALVSGGLTRDLAQ